MNKHAHTFFSYSRKSERRARALEQVVGKPGLQVWRECAEFSNEFEIGDIS